MKKDILRETERRLRRAQVQVCKYEKRNDLSHHGEKSLAYFLGKVSAYETILEMIKSNMEPPTTLN